MAEPEDRLTLGPLAAGQFERHSMRESFHVVLAFDDRMPVRYGGHGGTRPGSPEPKIPVASWVLSRLQHLVSGQLHQAITFDQEELSVRMLATFGPTIGAIQLVLERNGEMRVMFRGADVQALKRLEHGFVTLLFRDVDSLAPIATRFESGAEFGYRESALLGELDPDFDLADLVDRILGGTSVARLPDDSVQRCPITPLEIAAQFSCDLTKPPLAENRVKYIQSANLGSAQAWVFGLTRTGCHAVVLVVAGREAEVQFIG